MVRVSLSDEKDVCLSDAALKSFFIGSSPSILGRVAATSRGVVGSGAGMKV